MQLAYGFSFEELYSEAALPRLDAQFVQQLGIADTELHNRLVTARACPEALADKEHSQLLIDLAPQLEDFIAALFGIEKEVQALAESHDALAPVFACKRLFIQRRAAKAFAPEVAASLAPALVVSDELGFAKQVLAWMENETAHVLELQAATEYAAWALYSAEGKRKHHAGVLFKQPKKIDPMHLVPHETEVVDGVTMLKGAHRRFRQGFALTDDGGTQAQALDAAHYCIFCHNQGKDSCSKGLKEKDGAFKASPLGVALAGCPLEEKISEMNFLKSIGVAVGALAVVCADNPMCAGTGHRICNDCMKSCIYQKQEPVDIPRAETRTLKDVLNLPYGFEIYSLFTRWNPLNLVRPLPKPKTGRKVLIAGLGPAGYTLAHHLLNDGHTVVGIDGLKIEPLPERLLREPVKHIASFWQKLDERIMAGFGGVAEYGITVRWDKNYLTLIRLLLERRARFRMFGAVRFGGQIGYESAFALGFDHIALCLGAGKPTVLDIPNGLARGVRAASDFLMALQLTGAAKTDSIANLQLRLPVVVVGGGLTAIDTATEARAYYPLQVEKFLARYELLVKERSEKAVRAAWNAEEQGVADEFISHARALRAASKEEADRLIDRWGGVTIAYRKQLTDAPSYRLNHEEVEKALEEGIFFAEGLTPTAIETDAYGHAQALVCGETRLPARAILVAAGTSPNTVLAREDAEHFALDGKYFRAVDEAGTTISPERSAKPKQVRVLMHMEPDGRAVSFFGDLHPSFFGNVVKAMGSAKQGYPVVSRVLEKLPSALLDTPAFLQQLETQLTARVHAVNRLTPTIVEVVIHAPLAAQAFQPGQFYRLQNFETFAASNSQLATTLSMEGLAMTGAQADKARGLISLIVLEMGGSSDLCAYLRPGEPVALMGPTGEPTEIPPRETVLLAGGGLGNAVLFSIGAELRARGSRVLYFAGYRTLADRYKETEIEAAADVVIWACDEAPGFVPARAQDRAFSGNIVQAMLAYGEGKLGAAGIALSDVNRIIAIGSDRMMAAVAEARHGALKPYLQPGHRAIGSINSPMQCMMKEICAQCLQKHRDPATGKEHYVFSCAGQDQPLDSVDFQYLNARLMQNGVQEKLTRQWIDHCLRGLGMRKNAA